MRVPFLAVASLAFALAGPAFAAQQLFTFSGIASVAPSGSPIAALQAFAGATVQGQFVIDTAAAGFQPTAPAGGQGQAGLLTGAVKGGTISLFAGGNGTMTLLSTANDFGNIFTIDNGGAPNPAARLDQMGYSTGTRLVSGNLLKAYDILGTLPPDVFFGSLFFGRTLQGPLENPPALVTDVGSRDFAGVLTGPIGNPVFLSITFRQGDPLINGTLSGLPLQSLSIGIQQLQITNIGDVVPEPRSWAMLIAGFGLVGAVMRRRRVAVRA